MDRFFIVPDKQLTTASSEKLLQEICRIFDESLKMSEKSKCTDALKRVHILYHFGTSLKRWAYFRSGSDRWEPIFDQVHYTTIEPKTTHFCLLTLTMYCYFYYYLGFGKV